MGKNPAGMTVCFTCEFWSGSRQFEEPGYVSYQDENALCENPSSPFFNLQLQPGAGCPQWAKWRKVP
jgi:hypothetical protein